MKKLTLQEISTLYLENKKSPAEIAALIGMSPQLVYNLLKKMGIFKPKPKGKKATFSLEEIEAFKASMFKK